MDKDRIWTREEVPEEYTWRLEDVYAGDEAWMLQINKLELARFI